MGRVLALANQKGGVGKTTAAINLAAIWAQSVRVLLIDADPQGNATTGLGVPDGGAEYTLAEVLAGECSAEKAILPTRFGLSLLPADVGLAAVEATEAPVTRLRELLRPVLDAFDMTVIDCPPSLSRLTLNALVAADRVLIPIKPGRFSLKGLQQLFATMESLRLRGVNPGLRAVGGFYNEVSTRTNLYRSVDEALRRAYPQLLLESAVPMNVRIGEAQVVGEPISTYDATAAGAEAYTALAKEVLERWERVIRLP